MRNYSQLGFWFADSADASGDRASGLNMLQAYFDEASQIPGFQFTNFDNFLSWAELGSKVATDIGELVRINNISTTESQAINRLRDLAVKSEGKASRSQIVMAAGGTGDTVNWSEFIPAVAYDTGESAIDKFTDYASDIESGVTGTFSAIRYLPWILGGFGVLYIYVLARGHSGFSIKDKIKRKKEEVTKRVKDKASELKSLAKQKLRINPRRKIKRRKKRK